jgi:hypothetical protein
MTEIQLVQWRLRLTLMQVEILLDAATNPDMEPLIEPGFFKDPELLLYLPPEAKEFWHQSLMLRDYGLMQYQENRPSITPEGMVLVKALFPLRWAITIDRVHDHSDAPDLRRARHDLQAHPQQRNCAGTHDQCAVRSKQGRDKERLTTPGIAKGYRAGKSQKTR